MADYDILVVGLGPVGAVMTGLLAQHGMRVLAVEQDTDVYPLPRAAHVDQETLRILQRLGAAEAVVASGMAAPDYVFRNAAGETLMHVPARRALGDQGWPPSVMFHQPALERAVRASLARDPRVEVRLGRRLVHFDARADGVLATLEHEGGADTVRAHYLVACDGASSGVRARCGVGLFDYGFDEPWLVLDVVLGEGAEMPPENLQLCDPARPTTCLHMGSGRHRWEFMLRPDETADEVLDDEAITHLLTPWRIGNGARIERKAVYRFHGLVAEQWREGRVLLAGDAAHQTPPFAGQGLCSGIKDAANLAWKLAAVVRGDAHEALLDTYQLEREPQVRAVIELAIFMGRLVCAVDPAAAAERDRMMLDRWAAGAAPADFPRPRIAEGLLLAGSPGAGDLFPQFCAPDDGQRLDEVLGCGPWLIARKTRSTVVDGLRTVSVGGELERFAGGLSAWLDAHRAEAVLVRPDRYTFGTGDAATLATAWTARLDRDPAQRRSQRF